MRTTTPHRCLAAILPIVTVACATPIMAAESPSPREFVARATRAGLRVIEGDHLTLATDRPPRSGDGVEDLPRVFDAAFASWCEHYGIDPARHSGWRAIGCLVVDRERFRAAGLLPSSVPDFTNGFCANERFWMSDQSNPAYRRHLLLHEGVHAFTLTLRSLATPTWYTEGIAEYLATHRIESGRFLHTPIPRQASDVEQLGRIEHVQSLVAAGTAPTLLDVFAVEPSEHRSLGPYAASWAAVAMLAGHPRYAAVFASAERGSLDASFTERLRRARGWDDAVAVRDFAAFLDDIDYGYDFSRSAIDWSPGRPVTSPSTFEVDAGGGWQNTGLVLEAGRRYAMSALGRCRLGRSGRRAIESGPDGISLDWHRGRPVGRLLLAQWIDGEGLRPAFRVLADGGASEFTVDRDGVAFARINESPGNLADNDGILRVGLRPIGGPGD